jgi:hypothetical protein
VDFDHSANTYTGKSTIMSVIHSIAVSKVAGIYTILFVLWNDQGRDVQNAANQVILYYLHKY